jgi:hypothetical protein
MAVGLLASCQPQVTSPSAGGGAPAEREPQINAGPASSPGGTPAHLTAHPVPASVPAAVGDTGFLQVALTDLPTAPNVTEVSVCLARLDVVFSDDQPIATIDVARTIDLLTLRGGITTSLGITELPVGVVQQLRLILCPDGNGAVIDGELVPLKIPGGEQTGIKLTRPGGFAVSDGVTTTVIIDFDAQRSLHFAPGQGWMLTPVVQLVEEAILLAVTSPAPGAVVKPTFTVTGTVASQEPLASLTVNGVPATVSGVDFSVELTVPEGPTTIVIEAEDAFGRQAVASLEVIADGTLPQILILSPADGAVVSLGALTVSGVVADTSAVAVTVNGVPALVSGGTFTASGVSVGPGTTVLTATVVDAAGNTSFASVSVTTDPSAVVATVGPEGGVVAAPAGSALEGISIVVPPGAVDGATAVGFTLSRTAPPLDPALAPLGPVIDAQASRSFNLPVTVVLPFASAAAQYLRIGPRDVRFLTAEGGGPWTVVPGVTVRPTDARVEAAVTGFSWLTVGGLYSEDLKVTLMGGAPVGTCTYPAGTSSGTPATETCMGEPSNLLVDDQGTLFFLERRAEGDLGDTDRIRKIQGGTISTVYPASGQTTIRGLFLEGTRLVFLEYGSGTTMALKRLDPRAGGPPEVRMTFGVQLEAGLATDPEGGDAYFLAVFKASDAAHTCRVYRADIATQTLERVVGPGGASDGCGANANLWASDPVPGDQVQLDVPMEVEPKLVPGAGSVLFMADGNNRRVLALNVSATSDAQVRGTIVPPRHVLLAAGSSTPLPPSGAGGPAGALSLCSPLGLAATGSLLMVSDNCGPDLSQGGQGSVLVVEVPLGSSGNDLTTRVTMDNGVAWAPEFATTGNAANLVKLGLTPSLAFGGSAGQETLWISDNQVKAIYRIDFADRDNDGVGDSRDNCPDVWNPDQYDSNSDLVGDACDLDGDGIRDSVDNCPLVPNADQADSNHNGIGDVCEEPDFDGDGVPDSVDNCLRTANPNQEDANGDGVGDACDRDGDGVPDDVPGSEGGDNCPDLHNPGQEDSVGNGVGDACRDSDGDGVPDKGDSCPTLPNIGDADHDGVDDICDNCPGVANAAQESPCPGPALAVAPSAPSAVTLPRIVDLEAHHTGGLGPFAYQWTQTSGVPVTIRSPRQHRARAILLATGTYCFRVTVTDSSPGQVEGTTCTDAAGGNPWTPTGYQSAITVTPATGGTLWLDQQGSGSRVEFPPDAVARDTLYRVVKYAPPPANVQLFDDGSPGGTAASISGNAYDIIGDDEVLAEAASVIIGPLGQVSGYSQYVMDREPSPSSPGWRQDTDGAPMDPDGPDEDIGQTWNDVEGTVTAKVRHFTARAATRSCAAWPQVGTTTIGGSGGSGYVLTVYTYHRSNPRPRRDDLGWSRNAPRRPFIMVHSTGGRNNDCLTNSIIYARNVSRYPAHYYVGQDGNIVEVVPARYYTQHGNQMNQVAIGIELVRRENSTDPYPQAQLDALARLVLTLSAQYGVVIPEPYYRGGIRVPIRNRVPSGTQWDQVVAHRETYSGHVDPQGLSVEEVVTRIRALLSSEYWPPPDEWTRVPEAGNAMDFIQVPAAGPVAEGANGGNVDISISPTLYRFPATTDVLGPGVYTIGPGTYDYRRVDGVNLFVRGDTVINCEGMFWAQQIFQDQGSEGRSLTIRSNSGVTFGRAWLAPIPLPSGGKGGRLTVRLGNVARPLWMNDFSAQGVSPNAQTGFPGGQGGDIRIATSGIDVLLGYDTVSTDLYWDLFGDKGDSIFTDAGRGGDGGRGGSLWMSVQPLAHAASASLWYRGAVKVRAFGGAGGDAASDIARGGWGGDGGDITLKARAYGSPDSIDVSGGVGGHNYIYLEPNGKDGTVTISP